MKNIIWILVFTVAMYACNNSTQTNNASKDSLNVKNKIGMDEESMRFLGAWVVPKPAKLGEVEGFYLKADSVAESINSHMLHYQKWWRSGDLLIFTIHSGDSIHSIVVNDTLVVYHVNADSLVMAPIQNKNVKAVYRKQNIPNAPLANTKWKLAIMDGMAMSDSIFIQFDTLNAKITGFGGCNFINGTFKKGHSSLRISNLSLTKKVCASDMNKVETKLFAYIQSTNNYFIVGDELQLREGAKTLAIFKARN